MRTTLDLDDDVLQAIKSLAGHRGISAGRLLSELAREALKPDGARKKRHGFILFPAAKKGRPAAALELVNRLRDESA